MISNINQSVNPNESFISSRLLTEESNDNEFVVIELSSTPVSEELETLKQIGDLNWAWVYQEASGKWSQFECINCMILESKWNQWKQDPTFTVNILVGISSALVDFSKMIMI